MAIRVIGHLGTWIDPYDDDPLAAEGELVSVAYYHAVLAGEEVVRVDPAEASEAGWFEPDALPRPLAPSGNGERIFAAWRAALAAGELVSPLRDVR